MKKCLHTSCNQEIFQNDKCIFHCEKNNENGWFEIKDQKKEWNKKLTNKFWKKLRKKMQLENEDNSCKTHDFSFFIFPEFESFLHSPDLESLENLNDFKIRKTNGLRVYQTLKDFNFWNKNAEMIFSKNVDFWEAKFLGKTYLPYIIFSKESRFNKATFFEKVEFTGSTFFELTNFWNTTFLKKAVFSSSKFLDETKFDHSIFKKEARFLDTRFENSVYFWNTKLFGKANFERTSFFKTAYFRRTLFLNKAYFWNTKFFWKAYFRSVTFSPDRQTFFKNVKFNGFTPNKQEIIPADFHNIVFPETVLFRKTDLSRVSFLDSNIEKARFDECEWSKFNYKFDKKNSKKNISDFKIKFFKSKSRNVLWDEYVIKDNRPFLQKFFWMFHLKQRKFFENKFKKTTKQQFQQVENLNRQFKKNFDDKQDYQTADDFYIGEMTMRRKSLIAEFKNTKWWKVPPNVYGKRFFLWFYKWFSNYNSNPTWVLAWLLLIIFVFTIIFHITEYGFDLVQEFKQLTSYIKNYKFLEFLEYNWLTPLHYSFSSSIPLIEFPEEIINGARGMNGWTIFFHYLQVIFSTIIWTLLIISLRRKFRR